MVLSAEQFRQRRVLKHYGQNAAGNLVRSGAFRACDYTAEGSLHEFADPLGVLAFEAERYKDGTGFQVKFTSKPNPTVPPEQLALKEAVADIVQQDGHQTRAQIEAAEENIHSRFDGLVSKVDALLVYHEKAPPSRPDDVQLLAQVHKQISVGRMNCLLRENFIDRKYGWRKEDKAVALIEHMPRDKLMRVLEGDGDAQGPQSKRAKVDKSQLSLTKMFDKTLSSEVPTPSTGSPSASSQYIAEPEDSAQTAIEEDTDEAGHGAQESLRFRIASE
jgi:hypothetical protein